MHSILAPLAPCRWLPPPEGHSTAGYCTAYDRARTSPGQSNSDAKHSPRSPGTIPAASARRTPRAVFLSGEGVRHLAGCGEAHAPECWDGTMRDGFSLAADPAGLTRGDEKRRNRALSRKEKLTVARPHLAVRGGYGDSATRVVRLPHRTPKMPPAAACHRFEPESRCGIY